MIDEKEEKELHDLIVDYLYKHEITTQEFLELITDKKFWVYMGKSRIEIRKIKKMAIAKQLAKNIKQAQALNHKTRLKILLAIYNSDVLGIGRPKRKSKER